MIPDVLRAARDEAAARTGGKVAILTPGRGDFRIDGARGEMPDFREGAGLTARAANGVLFVDMGSYWYGEAARQWNAVEIQPGGSDFPDAHLCARLIEREAAVADVSADERGLMRRLMETPFILSRGGETLRARYSLECAAILRPMYARALAENAPLYALRGCACMLAALMGGRIPVRCALSISDVRRVDG